MWSQFVANNQHKVKLGQVNIDEDGTLHKRFCADPVVLNSLAVGSKHTSYSTSSSPVTSLPTLDL